MPKLPRKHQAAVAKFSERLAHRIAGLRDEKGMSVKALSESTGLTRATLHNIESGGANPCLSTLVLLSDALSVPVDYLVR